MLFTHTFNDTVGPSDSPVRDAVSASGTETVGLTDVASTQMSTSSAFVRQVDDLAGVGDAGRRTARAAIGSDPLGFTDGASAQIMDTQTHSRQVNDSAGVGDAGRRTARAAIGSDPLGITDTATHQLVGGTPAVTRTVTDGVGLADADSPQRVDVAEAVTDPIGLVDTAARQASTSGGPQAVDSTGLSDSVRAALASVRTVADLLALTDTVTATTGAIDGMPGPATVRVTSPTATIRLTRP